jgi:hypothetical protein
VVAKAETRWSGGCPAARSWLRREVFVDRHHVRPIGPGLAHPGREGRREQARVNPVQQDGEPARPRHPMMVGQEPPQERQMRLAPFRDPFVVVAIGDRAAHHKEQDLRQGMRHTPWLARVLDDR